MNCFSYCGICDDKMPPFAITPILQGEDGTMAACCEQCANEHFPGWEEDDKDDSYEWQK